MKVYAWLIDLIHRRKNCPTGMISGWVQKVTQHNGIIQYTPKQLPLVIRVIRGQAIFEDRATSSRQWKGSGCYFQPLATASSWTGDESKQASNQSIDVHQALVTKIYSKFSSSTELRTILHILDDESSHLIPQSIHWTSVRSKKGKKTTENDCDVHCNAN